MKAEVYNQKGEKVRSIELPEELFSAPWKADLVHQVVVSMNANKRFGNAKVKDRSEVRGGGKKPWRQKGTGRARHGSRRSPIWIGGGVTHGPRTEKNHSKKVTKKMKQRAFASVLSQKVRDGEVIFLDKISFSKPKTKEAREMLNSLEKKASFDGLLSKRKNSAILSLSKKDDVIEKSFSNLGNMEIEETRSINPLDLLTYKYIIIENSDDSIKILESRMNPEVKTDKN